MVIRTHRKLAVCFISAFWSLGVAASAQSGGEQLRGPAFVPDETFKGSTLDGWHKLGQADWSIDNGEVVGKGSAGSGWQSNLVHDRNALLSLPVGPNQTASSGRGTAKPSLNCRA